MMRKFYDKGFDVWSLNNAGMIGWYSYPCRRTSFDANAAG